VVITAATRAVEADSDWEGGVQMCTGGIAPPYSVYLLTLSLEAAGLRE
jgi:hypothetical protein